MFKIKKTKQKETFFFLSFKEIRTTQLIRLFHFKVEIKIKQNENVEIVRTSPLTKCNESLSGHETR